MSAAMQELSKAAGVWSTLPPLYVMPTPEPDADWALLRAHLRGDPHAFAQLMERHRPVVQNFIRDRLRRYGWKGDELALLADDVWQELWWRVHKHAAHAREEFRFAGWVRTIADNLMKNLVRQAGRRPVRFTAGSEGLEAQLPDRTLEADAELVRAEQVAQVWEAMRTVLSPTQYRVLELRAWYDYSYEQIAAAMDLPLGTVRSRLNRSKVLVREYLTTRGTDDRAE